MSRPAPGDAVELDRPDVVAEGRSGALRRSDHPGGRTEGRQSQTWVRFAEGWRIVAAHVSEVPVDGRST